MSEHSPTSAVRPRIRLARGMSWERIMLLLIVFYLGGRELLPAIRTFAQAQTQAGAPNANGLPATAFTYQGRVELDGVPLTGTYDLTFNLWDAATLGVLQGTSGPSATQITNGLFAATLDFNQAYTEGKRRWVETIIDPPGAAPAVSLGRIELTVPPHDHLHEDWIGSSDGPALTLRNLGSGNALNLEAGTGQALSILGPGGANPAVNVSVQGNGAGIAVTSGNGPGIAVSGGNGFAIDAVGPADISTIRGRNVYSSCVYIGCNGVQGHSTNGAGVGGYGKLGVYGEGEQGVYGAGDGVGKAGVTGTSNRFGGCSQSSLSTYCYGVIGEATTPSGNTGIGVSGVGTFAGIYGRDTVAGSWAGYFDGRMATRDILPISDNAWFLGNLTHRWNQIHSTNSLQVTSDRRAKKDIADLAYGLNDILKLRPVTFRWNEGTDETTHLGLIAQEVRAIIPEAIHGEESEGMLSMTPDAFIPVLIRAIQEQDREIEGLRAEVRGLTGAASPATFMANNSPTTWPVFAALVMGAMGLICGGSALAVTLRR